MFLNLHVVQEYAFRSLFMKWYNYERPHMSLNYDERETPWQAFQRKMPPTGAAVVDEQTREEYEVE